MDLETYQRSLYRLVIHGTPAFDDPPYVQTLVGSSRLSVVREIICFWRAHGLERYCILTATWLKRAGRFEADIESFVTTGRFSPYVEEAGQQFLCYLVGDSDPIVAALAKFEIALHETRLDSSQKRLVEWPCDPRPVLSFILNDSDFPDQVVSNRYRVMVNRTLPGGFVCESIENE